MICAERKPFDEIMKLVEGKKKVLLLGCGTCVKVCFAGGDKEVAQLALQMNLANKKAKRNVTVTEMTIERQCEDEFIQDVAGQVKDYDVVMSMACGVGVQMVASRHPKTNVVPGVNTTFYGYLEKQGLFMENCQGCGTCVLGEYGAVCPVARCSKSLMNGPCGGSHDGKCEVNDDILCGWQMIYDRLKALGQLDKLNKTVPPKNWSTARHGGPRKLVLEEQILP